MTSEQKNETLPKDENGKSILQGLIDWSKWVIGINFAAATGCGIAFVEKEDLRGCALLCAILFFALTVFVSVIFTFFLTVQTQKPFKRMYHYVLGLLQILLFMVAVRYLYNWIDNKTPKAKECLNCNCKNLEIQKTDTTVTVRCK